MNKPNPAVRRRLCAAFLLLPFAAGCGGKKNPLRREGVFFGTAVKILIPADSPAAQEAVGAIFAAFAAAHRRFHAWRGGETGDLNAAIAAGRLPARVSPPLQKMLRLAADCADASEGLFNPAMGNIVAKWGFHADAPGEGFLSPPPESFVREAAADMPTLAGMKIGGGKLISIHPRARLDFGAIAKGAALDEARGILAAHGIYDALLNIGGNILAVGNNGARLWRIALAAAFDGGIVNLRGGEAIATSGDSQRFFIHKQKRYHHLIDPRTARPAAQVKTAAAISGDAANAGALSDAAATALALVADSESARRIAANFRLRAAANTPPPVFFGDFSARLI
jgi:thiamine biosynthesis lipoprotein